MALLHAMNRVGRRWLAIFFELNKDSRWGIPSQYATYNNSTDEIIHKKKEKEKEKKKEEEERKGGDENRKGTRIKKNISNIRKEKVNNKR